MVLINEKTKEIVSNDYRTYKKNHYSECDEFLAPLIVLLDAYGYTVNTASRGKCYPIILESGLPIFNNNIIIEFDKFYEDLIPLSEKGYEISKKNNSLILKTKIPYEGKVNEYNSNLVTVINKIYNDLEEIIKSNKKK